MKQNSEAKKRQNFEELEKLEKEREEGGKEMMILGSGGLSQQCLVCHTW